MVDLTLLNKAGLTEGEGKVYMALLETGQSSITEIVKKSGISTSKSYDVLNRLEEKGLVSHVIMNNIKYFKAASPDRILDFLQDKNKEIEETISKIENILPELISKQEAKEGEEEAEIYVGIKGLISVFNEETEWMKKTNEISYAIGLTKGGKSGKEVDKYFDRTQYKRDKLKLKVHIIANKNSKGLFPYLEKSKYVDIRYIEAGSEMVSMNIYADKLIVAVYSKRPFLFVIKSKDLVKDFKEYFNSLWKIAKR